MLGTHCFTTWVRHGSHLPATGGHFCKLHTGKDQRSNLQAGEVFVQSNQNAVQVGLRHGLLTMQVPSTLQAATQHAWITGITCNIWVLWQHLGAMATSGCHSSDRSHYPVKIYRPKKKVLMIHISSLCNDTLITFFAAETHKPRNPFYRFLLAVNTIATQRLSAVTVMLETDIAASTIRKMCQYSLIRWESPWMIYW